MAINADILKKQYEMATADQKKAFEASDLGKQYLSSINPSAAQTIATAPTTTPTIAPVPEAATPQQDYTAQIAAQQKAFIEAQKASQLASLEKSYNSSLGSLNQEGVKIPQTYKAARTQADTQFQQNARRFSDYLAQRGLASSGSAAQGFMNLTGFMQGAKSQANTDQANALADLSRRRSDLDTGYQYDRNAINAGGAADLAKYQIESLMNEQSRYYNQLDKADDRAYDESLYQRDKADLEASNAKQAQLDTLGRYANDYTQGIIDIKGDGDPSNDWLVPYLEAARTQKVSAQEAAKSEAQSALYEQAMDTWKILGYVPSAYAEILGVPAGTSTSDYAYKQAQLALDQFKAQTSRINATSSGSGSGGSGGTGGMTYKEFESTVLTTAESDPYTALKYVEDNAAFIKEEKGYDFYQKFRDRIKGLVSAYGSANTSMKTGGSTDIPNPGFGILDVYNKLY